MAPQQGSTNTKASLNQVENNHAESSNLIAAQMELLMGIIQSYHEKTNATSTMMNEMKKMFEEKFNDLEKEKNLLKKQFVKDKIEREQDE